MPRPFRLFSAYDFFSVFVPGLAATFGLYLLIPRDIEVNLTAALIPTLVFAFVFGQALHAFSDFVHMLLAKLGLVSSHRERFAAAVAEPDDQNEVQIDKFKQVTVRFVGTSEMRHQMENGLSTQQWKALYPMVQSQVYNYGQGRSINFQAIYAFSRSMTVLLFGLPILFRIHHYVQEIGLFQRDPIYMEFFPTYSRLMEAALPLCIIGGVLFFISTYNYQRNFVKYLISDFIVIREDGDNDDSVSPIQYADRLN